MPEEPGARSREGARVGSKNKGRGWRRSRCRRSQGQTGARAGSRVRISVKGDTATPWPRAPDRPVIPLSLGTEH